MLSDTSTFSFCECTQTHKEEEHSAAWAEDILCSRCGACPMLPLLWKHKHQVQQFSVSKRRVVRVSYRRRLVPTAPLSDGPFFRPMPVDKRFTPRNSCTDRSMLAVEGCLHGPGGSTKVWSVLRVVATIEQAVAEKAAAVLTRRLWCSNY